MKKTEMEDLKARTTDLKERIEELRKIVQNLWDEQER